MHSILPIGLILPQSQDQNWLSLFCSSARYCLLFSFPWWIHPLLQGTPLTLSFIAAPEIYIFFSLWISINIFLGFSRTQSSYKLLIHRKWIVFLSTFNCLWRLFWVAQSIHELFILGWFFPWSSIMWKVVLKRYLAKVESRVEIVNFIKLLNRNFRFHKSRSG